MNTHTLADYLSAAVEAAKLGGAELERWRSKFAIREKSRADLVTDADIASQALIKQFLLDKFPDHVFVGEEDFVGRKIEDTRPAPGAPPTWVVDPLDGTCNYAHDFPAYCVSIGLWADDRPAVGVIFDPRQNELFTASAGAGAFLNGKPITVSAIPDIGQALLSTGFPANYPKQMRCLDAWRRVAEVAQSIRRTGSTALNLAYIACGRFDGYWAFDNWPWDVLAGAVLIAEAGGALQTADGQLFDAFRPDLATTNGKFQAELVEAIRDEPV